MWVRLRKLTGEASALGEGRAPDLWREKPYALMVLRTTRDSFN